MWCCELNPGAHEQWVSSILTELRSPYIYADRVSSCPDSSQTPDSPASTSQLLELLAWHQFFIVFYFYFYLLRQCLMYPLNLLNYSQGTLNF